MPEIEKIPDYDEHGRPLLQYDDLMKIAALEEVDFMNLPKHIQDAFYNTGHWHAMNRMQGGFDVRNLRTEDGSTFDEVLKKYKDKIYEEGIGDWES